MQSHNYSCIKIKFFTTKKGCFCSVCFRCGKECWDAAPSLLLYLTHCDVYMMSIRSYCVYHLRECNVPATRLHSFRCTMMRYFAFSSSCKLNDVNNSTLTRPTVFASTQTLTFCLVLNFQWRYFNSFHTVNNNQIEAQHNTNRVEEKNTEKRRTITKRKSGYLIRNIPKTKPESEHSWGL